MVNKLNVIKVDIDKKKNDPNDITVIYFDFANKANYQKIHKCMKDAIIR